MAENTITIDRAITATVREFCALSGLGVTKTYEMIDDGSLNSVKIGKRRLIVIDSYRRLLDRLATKAA